LKSLPQTGTDPFAERFIAMQDSRPAKGLARFFAEMGIPQRK
jgi:hypothetical protein